VNHEDGCFWLIENFGDSHQRNRWVTGLEHLEVRWTQLLTVRLICRLIGIEAGKQSSVFGEYAVRKGSEKRLVLTLACVGWR
jgi:hypothetical protein